MAPYIFSIHVQGKKHLDIIFFDYFGSFFLPLDFSYRQMPIHFSEVLGSLDCFQWLEGLIFGISLLFTGSRCSFPYFSIISMRKWSLRKLRLEVLLTNTMIYSPVIYIKAKKVYKILNQRI